MTILVDKQFNQKLRHAYGLMTTLMGTLVHAVQNYPSDDEPFDADYYNAIYSTLPDFHEFFVDLSEATSELLAVSHKERATRSPLELVQLDRQWLGAPNELGVLVSTQLFLHTALDLLPVIDGSAEVRSKLVQLSNLVTAANVSHGIVSVSQGFSPPLLSARWNGSSELAH